MYWPTDEKRSDVILRLDDWEEWLHTENIEAARAMLQLYPAEDMVVELLTKAIPEKTNGTQRN